MFYLIYLVTGFFAGIIGGLLGTGGCALIMPVIRFGFHFDPAIAIGTTLTAVVFTAASGAYQHIKMNNVDKGTAKIIAISGIFGVVIGSVVFGYIKDYGKIIDLILGIAFLVVSGRMVYEGVFGKCPKNSADMTMPGTKTAKGVLGSLVGFLTGIIGLGGGYALVPAFIYSMRAPVKLAIGTSMASFVWMALVGAIFKIYQGVVNIPVAITLGMGAVIGAMYGAKLMGKIKPGILKALFGFLFLYVSLKYIMTYFGIHI
jgi:hypothetical protein